jgi:hypothetical protein
MGIVQRNEAGPSKRREMRLSQGSVSFAFSHEQRVFFSVQVSRTPLKIKELEGHESSSSGKVIIVKC